MPPDSPPTPRAVYGLIAAVAVLAAGCSASRGDDAPEAAALLVEVERVTEASGYTIRREFAGRVEARRQSQVGFELAGELAAVVVDEGDRVDAGAVVARLDTARLAARRAEAQAALDQAVSAAALAARTLDRNVDAHGFEGVSDQELDLARDNAAAARAALAAARARLEAVDVDLAKSTLRAPFDAIVVARQLDEGRIVSPGQPILSLQEDAPPDVRIGVAGDLAAAIAPGDRRTLRIGDGFADATVRAVLPLRDPATRTVDVILALDGKAAALPGDLARLDIEQRVDEAGFWLPINALAEGGRGLWTAYVAVPLPGAPTGSTGATHTLEPRAVEVLYEGASRVFVRGALGGGDLYVTGGLQRVVPNQQVRVGGGMAAAAARDGGR